LFQEAIEKVKDIDNNYHDIIALKSCDNNEVLDSLLLM